MTKIKANQLEIREILNDPTAQASETWKGTLRIATQAEVNGGSPYDNTLTITPQTLAGFSGLPNNWIDANNGADFAQAPSAPGVGFNNISIGNTSSAYGVSAVAIGRISTASATDSIAIGTSATAGANYCVAIGRTANMTGQNGVGVGSVLGTQVAQSLFGTGISNLVTTTDVPYAAKIGYGVSGGNKNMLHLFSKGKLELYGQEAQFIFPNYASAGSPLLPSTTIDGGTVYDLSTNTLKFYNGTAWTELNSQNWLIANTGNDFTITPSASGTNAISSGHNAHANGSAAVVLGSNASASINAVNSLALGKNSDTFGSSSIAIGYGAQSGTASEGATIAIGLNSSSVLGHQISIGNGVNASTVSPTDVQYSVKIGYGPVGIDKNMLHLFSKGKLELYGEEAQYIMPNYAVTGSPIDVPANSVEGGVIYDSVAQGLQVYDGASWSVVGGGASNNWLTANSGYDFGTVPTALADNAIALGNNAQSTNTAAIAIGLNSLSNDANAIAIGTAAASYDTSAIAIGNGSKSSAVGEPNGVTLGVVSQALKASQVSVGNFLTVTSVTPTDVQYSVKLGYGFANEHKNMLHLFSKGKLELYGDEAQYIMPNYAVTGSPIDVPAVAVEGGVIYDSAAQGLKVYDGASWSVVGAANNWLTANSGDNFITPPAALFSNSIALGNNSTSVANESISIGSNTRGELNSVTLGINSGAYAQSCISIGSGAKAGTVSETGCIAMGLATQARKLSQVSIGTSISTTSVTPTDVQYSVKLGFGFTGNTNKNMLHLFSKGKLELYGESAQFIMPNYAMGSPTVEPATATEGGVIYDSTAKGLQLYDGASWSAIGGGGGDIVTGSPAQHVIIDQYQNIVGGSGAGDSVSATAVDNVFLGEKSGNLMSGGKENVFIGIYTGQNSVNGSYNVCIGKSAGINLGSEFANIGIGNYALGINSAGVNGSYNISIGQNTLPDITTGAYNTVIGSDAGNNITTGSYNICLGYGAGPTTNQSNQLFIDIAPSDTPLIHGNFSTNVVTIHGELSMGVGGSPVLFNSITSLKDPTNTQDAATKNYVDNSGTSPGGLDTQIQYNNGTAFGGDADFTYNDVTGAVTVTGDSADDVGIIIATNTTAYTFSPAIYGNNSTGYGGYGVKGVANGGEANAVFGRTSSTTGVGVKGVANAITGDTVGVYGRIDSTTAAATGIKGVSSKSTGATFGVVGSSGSTTGYGGYFINIDGSDTKLSCAGSTVLLKGSLDAVEKFSIDDTGEANFAGNVISHIAFVTDATASHPVVLTDDGKIIKMTSSSANTVQIPAEGSIDFPIGTQILITQEGTGQTTIAITTDTLNSAGGLVLLASQFSTATIIKTASLTWLLAGDLA